MRWLPAAVGLALLTAGCSQTDALAPVGGNHPTEVRFAAIDLLTQHGVPVMVAPVCTDVDDDVTCEGSTTDGTVISVRSSAAARTEMTVTVGSDVLYDGSIQDVLDAAARPTG